MSSESRTGAGRHCSLEDDDVARLDLGVPEHAVLGKELAAEALAPPL